VGFVARELTADTPIVDLRVLGRSRNLSVGTFLSFVLGFGLFASVFIIPIFCQRILGFSATQTGVLLLPGALLAGFMMPVVGRLIQAGVSPKWLLPIGFVIFFLFAFWTSRQLSPTAGEGDFFWPLLLRGVGLGMLFLPITVLSLGGLGGKDAGQAAGLTGMIRQLGGSFGVALVGTYIERTGVHNRAALLPNISLYNVEVQQRVQSLIAGFMAKGAGVAQARQQAYAVLEGLLTKQSLLITYSQAFTTIGIFFLFCLPFVLLIKRARPGEKVDVSAAH
jgi:DHA2 family multidrug resistance protein